MKDFIISWDKPSIFRETLSNLWYLYYSSVYLLGRVLKNNYIIIIEMPTYYTETGEKVRNPDAYALTGAPMYESKYNGSKDINAPTAIYKMNLQNGKKYIGKTTDVDRRMNQHFSGNGSKVTQKFKPISGEVIDVVPGFFSDEVEHEYTEEYIKSHGYNNVRGGYYTNSKTLKYEKKQKVITCYKCGKTGHYANRCFSKQSNSLIFF